MDPFTAKIQVLLPLVGLAGLYGWASKAEHKACPFHNYLSIGSGTGGLFYAGYLLLKFSGLIGNSNGDNKAIKGNTSKTLLNLIRKNILELQPYRCARDDYSEGILLDANENSFGPILSKHEEAKHTGLERYPDPYQWELKEFVAKYRGIKSNQLFIGVGSDEAIDILMRVFCEPGKDSILITPPTYGMYKVSAKVNDVNVIEVPLTSEFDVRVPEVLAAITPTTKLIFLCSPGNPTAKLIPIETIEEICKGAYGKCAVIVDEAYIDFSKDVQSASACQLIGKYENVIVLHTLSKAFGLAGVRCGFAAGNKDIIQILNNVKAPYNISSLTSSKALNAFQNLDELEKKKDLVKNEKERVMKILEDHKYVEKVHPSDTNFVLFQIPKAHELYQDLANNGVVSRYRGKELHCKDCIRVTIGKPHENDTFLDRLFKTADKLLHKI